ncbi:wall-associated receptor kinase 2-like [Panicum virgatum]|uniref:wall-associated receptor kinase 2-like n=1 Tax=Panicum virgatum TaxID=38727 RepID=UPI0019D5DB46|nr:wall-associated receptor kinase 2-like [Panicum virgatum]
MLQTSAAAAAVLMLVMAALQPRAAAAAATAPPPQQAPVIGQPNCTTTCGNVSVPYPFGLGPSRCYWRGFNLTCDTSHNPPRLLLGDDVDLRVADISLENATVRVMRAGSIINVTGDAITSDGAWSVPFGRAFTERGYLLSFVNKLVVFGCDVVATLLAQGGADDGETAPGLIGGCASLCTKARSDDEISTNTHDVTGITRQCTGTSGCCQSPVTMITTPSEVQAKRIYSGSTATAAAVEQKKNLPVNVFVVEEGWFDQLNWSVRADEVKEAPFILQWGVTSGLPQAPRHWGQCDDGVHRMLCKSKHSFCSTAFPAEGYKCGCDNGYQGNPYLPGGCQDVDECSLPPEQNGCFGECINTIGNGGFTCHCNKGYQGNPYITDGCKDIDECNITTTRCFGGVCKNLPGKFKCQCNLGTFGNPYKPHGCISLSKVLSKFITKNKIALSAASGPVLLLVVLGIMLVPRKIEQHKMKIMKQKHFKQNRGQLLQQLISQNADIAERMIIPLDELAKATNNFDKSRELGGGGHGTVYKGILSDLHVVAIKKSKITVQKEIDEFINEVAILSQINHKNVVKLFGCCLETEVPLLVYEFISNGTLYHHLHVEGPRSLSWGNRLRIATEIATSLAYLHSAVSTPIIHRDIKSSNILLDDTLTSKISDFGASRYIPVDQTGLTTRVQGTIGYLDPMYFCTSRLTEKSDVYSFGVILMELLTRKKPFSFLSTEGDGLVSHFLNLLDEGNLVQIIDPQVTEEGGQEVQEVAMLAASCINLRGEERPTMRLVEHTLEGLRGSKMYKNDDIVAVEFGNDRIAVNCLPSTNEGQRFQESSRRYSMEQEMMMSARYPR